jgi:predicted phage tail component-like protein
VASYTFIYNGVNLTNFIGVRTVDTTVLPPRENHAITIWERPGSIYNSYRYGERTITVTFLIRASQSEYRNNPSCMENKLNTLRNVFNVREPKPLYLGSSSRYIYAVPEGDFTMSEIRYDCYECEIRFICHNPEYYSSSVRATNNLAASTYGMRGISNNSNTIEVYNSGNASAYPIINIGINDITSFVQIENTTNGNKFLIGSYPKAGLSTLAPTTSKLSDDMTDTSRWIDRTPLIDGKLCLDSGRGYLGSIDTTSDGSGIKIAKAAPGTIWHGVSSYRELDTALDNFEVRAKLHLNSHGVNGDPTVPQLRDEGTIYSGERKYIYKVMAPSINIRDTPSIDGTVIGTYNKGQYVDPLAPMTRESKGWLQVEGGGYCEAVGLKRYIADSTVTDAAMNVATKKEVEVELMSRPSDDPSESILLATIPGDTPLRIHMYSVQGYYKLYIPYSGKIGYVDASKIDTENDDVSIEYPESDLIISDDNKTGICEVYGYSSTGTRLFKLCLSDENEYYSFVTPTVYIGENKALEDITTVSSGNRVSDTDEYDVSHDYLSEDNFDWNDFYGELGIRRENNRWQAWIYKIENGSTVKKLILKEKEISGAPTEQLHHITIYMGTQDMNNMCGMAITDIQVDKINDIYQTDCNVAPFKPGDEIKIDCYNNKVYLNNKLYNNIDINSKFIELVSGNNVLKATSNRPNMFVTVLFNERYL